MDKIKFDSQINKFTRIPFTWSTFISAQRKNRYTFYSKLRLFFLYKTSVVKVNCFMLAKVFNQSLLVDRNLWYGCKLYILQ